MKFDTNKIRQELVDKTIKKLKPVMEENKRADPESMNPPPKALFKEMEKLFSGIDINAPIDTLTVNYNWEGYDENIIKKTIKQIARAEDEWLRMVEDIPAFQNYHNAFSKEFLEELADKKYSICRIDLLRIINYFLILVDRETMIERTPRARLREIFKKVSPMGCFV
jgi:hypothetical protein